MFLEVGKSYVKHFYNDDLEECVKNRDGNIWTPERIKKAFNSGNGTQKDFKRYMKDNKRYAYFIKIEEKEQC